jgi:hypothetical protein
MTKFFTKAALAATVATGLFAAPALAANNTDNGSFKATATIQKPITLSSDEDLDFGTITLGSALTNSNVVVSRAGVRTCDPSATIVTCTGTATAAAFSLTGGVGGQTLNIDYGTVPPTLNSGLKTVPFTLDGPGSVTLLADGTGGFGVGGTIKVSDTTADGVYTANVDVTVTYQ